MGINSRRKSIRIRLYDRMVNRHAGIAYRYHKMHDGSHGLRKYLSWGYLLWLNMARDLFFCRFLEERPQEAVVYKKIPPIEKSESKVHREKHTELSVVEVVQRLEKHEVVSFDMFDTLIFRPLEKPTDLFYFVGEKLSYTDFRNVRIWAEYHAREKSLRERGHAEVTLEEIWEILSEETGTNKVEGMCAEMEAEEALCYANHFMLEIWNRLRSLQKRIVVTSDMYLPETCIRSILEKNGFTGAEQIFVSGEYKKSKADGSLFPLIKEALGTDDIIHVGDQEKSDYQIPLQNGIEAMLYPCAVQSAREYRPRAMSFLVGSAYRGIVSNYLYNGLAEYSMEYEYGFLYGGLFVLGYCRFIHDYCRQNGIGRILFLSRDGDTLRRAYGKLFPQDDYAYALWSRKAASKLMSDYDRHDYFRRFIFYKVNQGYTIRDVLRAMELETLAVDYELFGLNLEEELTDRNAPALKRFVRENWEQACLIYREQSEYAKEFYQELTKDQNKVAAVDIGWAGSGALSLGYLFEHAWKLPCEVIGILAGTNTASNAEPDATEPFRQSGRLVSYLYSPAENRDLYTHHDAGRGYNIYWELLLSSTEPQLDGFSKEGPVFGKNDKNPEGIKEIRRGILDFVAEYTKRFEKFPYMYRIEGRDAYAPMLAASGKHERYLRAIAERFELHVNVD